MPVLSPEHKQTNKTQGGNLLRAGERMGAEQSQYASMTLSHANDTATDEWHLNHGLEGANVVQIFAADKGRGGGSVTLGDPLLTSQPRFGTPGATRVGSAQ